MAISAYLGGKDRFDVAIADFATAYADKTETDYERVRRSEADGGRLTPRTRS